MPMLLLLTAAGCEPPQAPRTDNPSNELSIYDDYAPVKVEINPLTGFVKTENSPQPSGMNIFVNLLDSTGSQIKSPAVFRFELYRYTRYSSEPKGQRIHIWPDIDLTDQAENSASWKDFLRAYEFDLDLHSRTANDCVLQVTCLCPNGKRLSAERILKNNR